jgi:YbbR domain-containing protein
MQAKHPELDSQTVRFTVKADHTKIQAGDTLIVRTVKRVPDGVEVSAVPEKVVRDEAAKVFS